MTGLYHNSIGSLSEKISSAEAAPIRPSKTAVASKLTTTADAQGGGNTNYTLTSAKAKDE